MRIAQNIYSLKQIQWIPFSRSALGCRQSKSGALDPLPHVPQEVQRWRAPARVDGSAPQHPHKMPSKPLEETFTFKQPWS